MFPASVFLIHMNKLEKIKLRTENMLKVVEKTNKKTEVGRSICMSHKR